MGPLEGNVSIENIGLFLRTLFKVISDLLFKDLWQNLSFQVWGSPETNPEPQKINTEYKQ